MNLHRYLTTPSPSTGWLLEPGRAAAIRVDGKGRLSYVSAELPPSAFEVGRIGLQGVDGPVLEESLGRLQREVGGSRRAAVVVPTGWVRAHLLEFDELPRKRAQLDEVVRWRLKKLLPVRPTDLRLDVVPIKVADGRHHVLCITALERALQELEDAFRAVGVEPGVLTPRLFALATPWTQDGAGYRLAILQEADFVSMVLAADGVPRLVRLKPLPPTGAGTRVPASEMVLLLNYVREVLGASGDLEVAVVGDDVATVAEVRTWWETREGVQLVPQAFTATLGDAVAEQALGAARLAAMCAVTSWEAGV